jgi:large subunit ribosomal protein L3
LFVFRAGLVSKPAFSFFKIIIHIFFMKFIIGKKIEMTQTWRGDDLFSVTKVQVEPCTVLQLKTKDNDGYEAVQIGCGKKKEKNINKAQIGHFKKLGNFAKLKEFKTEVGDLKIGDQIDATTFEIGDKVEVVGVSKGKGFQGGVKRHGFKGHKMTHGNKDQQRMSGSVGAKGPARVFKGVKMPGRMGGDQVTVKNLEILDIDFENNILFVKGAIPGARNSFVNISAGGNLKLKASEQTKEIENKEEMPNSEQIEEIKTEAESEEQSKENNTEKI